MNQQQLLKKIDQAWNGLQQSYAGLIEAQLNRPGATGSWSVKDILGHITTWEEEAIKYLPVIMRGERPPRYKDLYGGIDAFNAQMTEQKHDLSITDIFQQLEDTHHQLLEIVRSAPDGQINQETPFRRRLRLDTYSHYPIHARAIRAWRESVAS